MGQQLFTVRSPKLVAALKATYCVAKDAPGSNLKRLQLLRVADSLSLSATDGVRIARHRIDGAVCSTADFSVTVETSVAKRLIRELAGRDIRVDILAEVAGDRHLVAINYVGDSAMQSTITEVYSFPNLSWHIPTRFTTETQVSRELLLSAVQHVNRVTIARDGRINLVSLCLAEGCVKVRAAATATVYDLSASVPPLSYDGATVTVTVQSAYLVSLLKNLASDVITLQANTPTSALVISSEGYTGLIMPYNPSGHSGG